MRGNKVAWCLIVNKNKDLRTSINQGKLKIVDFGESELVYADLNELFFVLVLCIFIEHSDFLL